MQHIDGWLPPLRAGRQPAGRALLSWLDDLRAPRLCLVSGASGAGKTHLVGWLATVGTSPGAPATRRPSAVLSAAGLSLDGAVWLLALRLGVAARTPAELLDELRWDDRSLLLLLSDLNRAAEPDRIVGELLDPLLALPNIRAVLEATPEAPSPGVLRSVAAPAVLDLDQPEWTDPVRFARWYQGLAPDSAFPAEAVLPNPRLALLAARLPAGTDTSAGVAAAWWSALPEQLGPAVLALAAADRPLTSEEWGALADPEAVHRAGQLLPSDSPTGDTWWLPAGPLRDAVTAGAPEPDHAAVVQALTGTLPRSSDGEPDPAEADADRLGLILRHSVRSGSAAALLDDPRFLASADPVAVTSAFATRPDGLLAAAWQAAGPALIGESDGSVRAAVLRSRLLGLDPDAADALVRPGAWQAEWASWQPPTAPQLLAGTLTQGRYAGHVLLVDAGGRLLAGELATGRFSEAAANPAPPQLRSLSTLADGSVVALDAAGHPQLLAGTGLPTLPELGDAELSALAPLGAVGDTTGRAHWIPDAVSERLHTGPVTALAALVLDANGLPTVVSGGLDGCVRAWEPASGPNPAPVDRRDCPVVAVGLGVGPQGVLAAAGWADGLVRIYLLEREDTVVDLRLGSPVRSVLIDSTGRIVVVLPDGVLSLTLDPRPPRRRDLSTVEGFYFSPEPPPAGLAAVTGRGELALSDTVRAEARRRPGQWLRAVDPAFGADGSIPSHGHVGWWQISHQGAIVRFVPDPAHRPSTAGRGTGRDLAGVPG